MENAKQHYVLPVFGIGFLIWLVATFAFRVAGQHFFIADSGTIVTILYLAVVPALSLAAIAVFRKYKLSGLDNTVAGALLVLPGMLLDAFVIQFFADVLPNLPPTSASTFGAWLMWAYAVVLITGLISGLRQHQKSQ